MPRNEIKAFAIADGANVASQNEWEHCETLKGGFKKGLARSAEINKAIRQSSSIAAAIAEFTAEKSGEDILDDGNINTLRKSFESALKNVSSNCIGEAEGDADIITVETEPAIKQLVHGQLVHIRAKDKNRTKTPNLKINQAPAKTIVKGNNLNLEEGDIAGRGHWLELQYDSHLDKWILQNPARGITPSSGVPAGTIEYFAMAVPPAGYLKADGRAVGREIYPELYTAIGTTFGEGDGSTTFNLPDLRGEFVRGWDDGRNLDTGRLFGSRQDYATRIGMTSDEKIVTGNIGASPSTMTGTLHFSRDGQQGNYGIDADAETRPNNIALLACIKAFDVVTNPGLIDITALAQEVSDKIPYAEFIGANQLLQGNGYQKLPGGLIIQWGRVSNANGGITTSNFPVPFKSIPFALVMTAYNAGNDALVLISTHARTATNFVWTAFVGTSIAVNANSVVGDFIAVGFAN